MSFSRGDSILLSGHRGFLGGWVSPILQQKGYGVFTVNADLRYEMPKIKVKHIIHLAGLVGGIEANMSRPGAFFMDNVLMGMNILRYALDHKAETLLIPGSTCMYPESLSPPFRTENLWAGRPHRTNGGYADAKRAVLAGAQAISAEHGIKLFYPIFPNLFGPGDRLQVDGAHVIPAMIMHMMDALAQNSGMVSLRGSGKEKREFLYVVDAANILISMLESGDSHLHGAPINIGGCDEVEMGDLAVRIAGLLDFKGSINWDGAEGGAMTRRLEPYVSSSLPKERFSLDEGLRATVQWYARNYYPKAVP